MNKDLDDVMDLISRSNFSTTEELENEMQAW